MVVEFGGFQGKVGGNFCSSGQLVNCDSCLIQTFNSVWKIHVCLFLFTERKDNCLVCFLSINGIYVYHCPLQAQRGIKTFQQPNYQKEKSNTLYSSRKKHSTVTNEVFPFLNSLIASHSTPAGTTREELLLNNAVRYWVKTTVQQLRHTKPCLYTPYCPNKR